MIYFFKKIDVKFLVIFFLGMQSLSLFAMNDGYENSNDLRAVLANSYGYGLRSSRASNFILEHRRVREEIKQAEDLLTKLEAECANPATEKERKHKLCIEISELQEDIERLKDINKGNMGDIWMRGLAGKDVDKVYDLRVGNKILRGIKLGLSIKLSSSISNAIGDTVDIYMGRIFNGVVGKVEEVCSFMYRYMFHFSRKPFTSEELKYWKQLISTELIEIDRMVKSAEKNDSRGKAEILREYEGDSARPESLNLWQDFIEDLINTCDNLIEEIDLRKGYYQRNNVGFGIVNSANCLTSKLSKIKKWLMVASSLKDFANTPEVKAIIPAMKKSLDLYFDNLDNLIKPLNQIRIGSGANRPSNPAPRRMPELFDGGPYPDFQMEDN